MQKTYIICDWMTVKVNIQGSIWVTYGNKYHCTGTETVALMIKVGIDMGQQ